MTPTGRRLLALIPAHNEAASLPAVVSDLRRYRPDVDILIVDDGLTDGTVALLDRLGVQWLHWAERRGVGSAVREGLRHAVTAGVDVVVRLDADGQHDVADIERLLRPVLNGSADAAIGSRYMAACPGETPGSIKRTLAALLSRLTRHTVTDATSGFWAFGPGAVSLLAEHHPGGYAEPELHLCLSRNGLRAVEVPVRARPRLNGRSSLTPPRLIAAAARVLLAMAMDPLREPASVGRDE